MLWSVIAVLVALVLVALVAGVLHLRRSIRVARQAIPGVRLDQIDPLRRECEQVFGQTLAQTLSLSDYEASAQALSACLDQVETLKRAFAKPDFYWYFVLPVGAFVGELIRSHAGGEWTLDDEGGGPALQVPVGDGVATTYPFDKVLRHATGGSKGDMLAYLMSARSLDTALAETGSG